MKELKNLVKSISNKDLPLASWYRASLNNDSNVEDGFVYNDIGNL